VSATGEFDSMASQVGQIADVMAAFGPRHMQVNAVGGEGEHTNGTKKESSHTVECSAARTNVVLQIVMSTITVV
jgi:hypothetical protein